MGSCSLMCCGSEPPLCWACSWANTCSRDTSHLTNHVETIYIKMTPKSDGAAGQTEFSLLASPTCTGCGSPDMLMSCGLCCSCSWAAPPCVFTCSEVGDWVGM